MEATKQEKIDLYRLMWRIRAFEEQGNLLYRKGLTHGILHCCTPRCTPKSDKSSHSKDAVSIHLEIPPNGFILPINGFIL